MISRSTAPSRPAGSLLALGAALPADRVPRGRDRRCAARPDEDAITLAVEAGAEALAQSPGATPAALVLATTTPAYDHGGSVQLVAELLRLPSDIAATELTATATDGLGALRLALALAAAESAPVLVCASHAGVADGDPEAGDGSVALLVGPPGPDGLAVLTAGPSHVEELRDRWRLRGEATTREGDTSFINEFGGTRLAVEIGRRAMAEVDAPVAVYCLNARAAGKAQAAVGGERDPVVARTGLLGAAHPLLRLACGLDAPQTVVAVAAGLGASVHATPQQGADVAAAKMRERALAGEDRDAPVPFPAAGFDPYSSGPRSWRERGQDLRLEGIRYGDLLTYPPAPVPPPDRLDAAPEVVALARTGTVLTYTRDHVYPGADVTGMVVLELDDGVRFYCQVASGEELGMGDRVRLVPRRLHQGGNVVQYFWKAAPCR
jgi:uncharacterized OB-fold protein